MKIYCTFLLYFKHNFIIILNIFIIVYIILIYWTSYVFESRILILNFQKTRKYISKFLLFEM